MDVNLFLLKLLKTQISWIKKDEVFDRQIERGTNGEYEQLIEREREMADRGRWVVGSEMVAVERLLRGRMRENMNQSTSAVSFLLGKTQHDYLHVPHLSYTLILAI
ncbi:hypothetical protein QL285_080112 [Trifolium repens]|nr:hypothetical protein QL285_080112 [Trifolium repens]